MPRTMSISLWVMVIDCSRKKSSLKSYSCLCTSCFALCRSVLSCPMPPSRWAIIYQTLYNWPKREHPIILQNQRYDICMCIYSRHFAAWRHTEYISSSCFLPFSVLAGIFWMESWKCTLFQAGQPQSSLFLQQVFLETEPFPFTFLMLMFFKHQLKCILPLSPSLN